MIKHSLLGLWYRLKTLINNWTRPRPVIHNANSADELRHNKRALVIYITRPFLVDADHPRLLNHQNARQCRQIVEMLGEFGYIVDVVDIWNKGFKPARDYDLVIANTRKTPHIRAARKIYLATTLCHPVHNRNLRRRHELLSRRRNYQVILRRHYSETMPYVIESDAIIGFGNEFIMASWKEMFNGPIYPFNNYGFKETEFLFDAKDFLMARKNFLFFASGSQMQKGLDLLLEIFPKHPDLQLYICSDFKREHDFCSCYQRA